MLVVPPEDKVLHLVESVNVEYSVMLAYTGFELEADGITAIVLMMEDMLVS